MHLSYHGFIAKESVVTTMQVLFGSEAGLTAILTPLSAVSMLVFSLLYTPCIAAVGAVRRELGGKWSVLLVLKSLRLIILYFLHAAA